jgi:hypothetical protein
MTKLWAVYVPLPKKGTRCGEKLSMWRDDVVAALCTSKKAAEAAARLLGDAKEIWEQPAVSEEPRHYCDCGDDD